ncbi:MAG: hypothetical protein BWY80_00668 [Firmicutes bacterium ADurb.Bin456]|nr:MAG: hypothetical protein BWY80_00668 [Firmicutes bacterium ADurb.Bin456]
MELLPVLFIQIPGADPVLINPGLGAENALGQLLPGHLQAEDGHRDAVLEGGVVGYAQAQAGLAHAWPSRQDNKITGLQTVAKPVQIAKGRGHAGDAATIIIKEFQAGKGFQKDVLDRRKSAGYPAAAQFHQHSLGFGNQFLRLLPLIVTHSRNSCG